MSITMSLQDQRRMFMMSDIFYRTKWLFYDLIIILMNYDSAFIMFTEDQYYFNYCK